MIPLDLEHLRKILERDPIKLQKFWAVLAPREIIIHSAELPEFRLLTQDKLSLFCKMCDIKLYKPGEIVDISNGGVILRGRLHKTAKRNITIDSNNGALLTDRKDDSDKKMLEEGDFTSDKRMTEGMKAQKNFLKKKQTLKNLGNLAKENGIAVGDDANDDTIESIKFIVPNPQAKDYIASGFQTVVILHFNQALLATRILRGQLSGEAVLNAWADHRRKRQDEAYLLDKMHDGFQNMFSGNNQFNPRGTLQAKRANNRLQLAASEIEEIDDP